jgi:hypothetical protein
MPTANQAFSHRLEALDLSLFERIPTESSDGDRRSWLAVQRSVRRPSGYVYLEIGSHLGGSIQQHLVDPWCRRIISIDKRPLEQPDDRGIVFGYPGNFSARMLENLGKIAPCELSKITCIDADARDVNPNLIPEPADFCFIDAEHTRAAVLSDFEFCLGVCTPDAAICFHDALTVRSAVRDIQSSLARRGIPFTAWRLDGGTFGIFLRGCAAVNDPFLRGCFVDGYDWDRAMRVWWLIPTWLRSLTRRVYRVLRRTHRPAGRFPSHR